MSTTAKIGAFFLAALVLLAILIMKIEDVRFGKHARTEKVEVHFKDVAGLDDKSAARIAGVRVGKVEKVMLLPDGTAVVRIGLEPDVELHQDASGQIRSLGLLGDKYVELTPGSTAAPRLPDGARIEGVSPGGFDDLTKLAQDIGKDVKNLTSALSASLGGPRGEERINRIVDNLGALAESLKLMVQENRGNVDATLANLREFSAQMRETLARVDRILDENRANLKGTVANADQVSEKLKTTADNLNSITGKIDTGQGTLGKLLNDDETHRNLNDALQSVKNGVDSLNTTLTRINRIQLDLGFRGEYMARESNVKSYFTLDVVPRENKFYRVELAAIPGGRRTDTYITTTTTTQGGQNAVVQQHVESYEDQFGLSVELGYRIKDTVLRAGLIESRGGVALDQNLFGDRLLMSAEGWDWGRKNASPHLKLGGRWNASPNLYITAGVDDVMNSDVRSLFIGGGLRWKDEDIKTMLPALPLLK